jgi:site-specific DNA recombinase
VLARGRAAESGSVRRVPAHEIETIVVEALRARFGPDTDERALVSDKLSCVRIEADRIELTLRDDEVVRVPWSPTSHKRQREILRTSPQPSRPMKAEARVVLLRSIALGRRWLDQIVCGTAAGVDAIAVREDCSKRQVERAIASAFLAPAIVKAAAEGRLPLGVNARALADAPMEWSRQWQVLGVSGS